MSPWWLRPTAEKVGPEPKPAEPEPARERTAPEAPPAEKRREAAEPRPSGGGAEKAPEKAPERAADQGSGKGPAKEPANGDRAGGSGRPRGRRGGRGSSGSGRARKRTRKKKKTAEVVEPAPETVVALEELLPIPKRTDSVNDEKKIALFCDLENIALGVRDSEIKKFDINLVLERLLEKGKIIVKKAYADWERYSDFKRTFHESAIEMIDIPQKRYSGKNSADIKMAVDALELSFTKDHLDTFVVLSGDSDFSPLVSKLKENNKYVIGVGVKNSSSNLLIDNCDEFLFYEDVWRDAQKTPKVDGMTKKTGEAFQLMVDSIKALMRENKDVLWGSMIKQTMQRKRPSFNEGYYGYSTFSELLEDAERKNVIKLKKDQRSGTYVVTGFAKR